MERIGLAIKKVREKNLGCGLVLKPENIYYLAEVFPSSRSMLLLREDPILYVSRIDQHLAKIAKVDVKVVQDFKDIKIDCNPVGVEEDYVSLKFYRKFLKDKKIENLDFLVDMRKIKDEKEIRNIKKAVKISEECMEEVFNLIQEGRTEKQIASEIVRFVKARGELAFAPIVALGKNSAIPHHSPTSRKARKGDVLLLDLGARVNYYNSDLTRTLSVGENKKFLELYAIVSEAQKSAIRECYAGNEIRKAEEAARRVLEEYGLKDYLLHSLGHGIGLEVHEHPRISSSSRGFFEKGMVVTIEPGVYKKFGVRIEDMILVGSKPKVLSRRKVL